MFDVLDVRCAGTSMLTISSITTTTTIGEEEEEEDEEHLLALDVTLYFTILLFNESCFSVVLSVS